MLADDERFSHSIVSAKLGTIEVELHHIRKLKIVPYTRTTSTLSNDPIHEKSKKLGGHRIQYVLTNIMSIKLNALN